jgi:hypothetical protein
LVIETAKKYNVRPRLGAYILAISRISEKAKVELNEDHYQCFAKFLYVRNIPLVYLTSGQSPLSSFGRWYIPEHAQEPPILLGWL